MENGLSYTEMGQRIKAARMQRLLGQSELARLIGVSQTHMSNIEHGKVGLTLEVLWRLTQVFGCSLDAIVIGKESTAALRPPEACSRLNDYRLSDRLQALELLRKA